MIINSPERGPHTAVGTRLSECTIVTAGSYRGCMAVRGIKLRGVDQCELLQVSPMVQVDDRR